MSNDENKSVYVTSDENNSASVILDCNTDNNENIENENNYSSVKYTRSGRRISKPNRFKDFENWTNKLVYRYS